MCKKKREPTFKELMDRGEVQLPGVFSTGSVLQPLPLQGVNLEATYTLLSWQGTGITAKQLKKLSRAQPQYRFDYHGSQRTVAYKCLNADLTTALAHGVEVVELVHGKGEGVLHASVRGWLRYCSCVVAFCETPGNSGSVLVRLRQPD